MTTREAVLLMAYGTPDSIADVPEYYTHIRGGRRPSDEAIADLERRYRTVGGGTPLRQITETVRDRLRAELASDGHDVAVYVGMKHWHPYIAEAVREMANAGIERVTAVALAPHYSRLSVGAYRHAVEEAASELGSPFDVSFVDSWFDQPAFVALIATRISAALADMQSAGTPLVVFTAHSLPVRIREWNDPYEAQLLESSAMVAMQLEIADWRFAWQSAGGSREPWIGPDILQYLETLRDEGVRSVLQVPIGFVCDHLEILYDIDVEAKQRAAELGMTLERTELPNASPDFVSMLAGVVRTVPTAVGSRRF
jgi:protoporphyrin/coproporphyrin ferrochelatase